MPYFAHRRQPFPALFLPLTILAVGLVGQPALSEEGQAPPDAGGLVRQAQTLEQLSVRSFHRESDLREVPLTSHSQMSMRPTPQLSSTANLVQHASSAALVHGERIQGASGIWSVMHTRNANGSFSLLRSTRETAQDLRVSIGNGEARELAARETIFWQCTSDEPAKQVRIESAAGKSIYLGEAKCGDTISVKHGGGQ